METWLLFPYWYWGILDQKSIANGVDTVLQNLHSWGEKQTSELFISLRMYTARSFWIKKKKIFHVNFIYSKIITVSSLLHLETHLLIPLRKKFRTSCFHLPYGLGLMAEGLLGFLFFQKWMPNFWPILSHLTAIIWITDLNWNCCHLG